MICKRPRVLLLVVSICFGKICISDDNKLPMSSLLIGKHLNVTYTENVVSTKKNASVKGNTLEGVSPLMMEWLCLRYKFTYSILDIEAPIENISGKRGQASYLSSGESDVIMAIIVGTAERLRYMELVHPWTHAEVGFIVPMPNHSGNNVDAVIKPFQLEVWTALAVAIVFVILALTCLNRSLKPNKKHWTVGQWPKISTIFLNSATGASLYVLRTLLNQGGNIPNRKIRIRLVIGAWCLSTFVLINAYNGILTSFMTATNPAKPIINSVEEVANDPSIKLLVDKGSGADVMFSTTKNGLYKVLGDKLRTYPKSRCNMTQQCIDMVKYLPRHVYLNSITSLKNAIEKDYLQTKQCSLWITDKKSTGNYYYYAVHWGLAKHSPYLEEFNRGTLYLREVGLTTQWEKWFSPDARPCMNGNKIIVNKSKPLLRLKLINMAGPFVVLGFGIIISIIVFLMEIMTFRWKRSTY